jgi:iron transport multicopper oxidase
MIERRIGLIVVTSFAGLAACDLPPAGGGGVEKATRAESVETPGATMSADSLRTGFYPNQPALDPATVGSPYFGQLFDTVLDGQIYAQPLYANGVVFVATETNHVYALDAATGSPLWTRTLGAPFLASDLNCGDLTPAIGVTGTPAIDTATGTAYLVSKTYANGVNGAAAFYAHAFDLETGDERAGFPLAIEGTAANDLQHVFDPEHQMQRPGLLLMNGVVYAAFGAHCDERPYTGWVVGISTQGAITTLWTSEAGAGLWGGGIWQAGGGLISDGAGEILFATGNDWSSLPSPVPGKLPPPTLGESIVRLSLADDGTLAATDFFSPANRDVLNYADADLGSGAPVALPASFGTPSHPNLLAQSGKLGYLYLLDRDDLGGYKQGAGGTDRVLQAIGPGGGVWSKPSVWPGDGGYVYVPVASGCSPDEPAGCLVGYKMGASADGAPMLSQVGTSSSTFGYGTSAVVVTSDGTRSGSALLWTVWSGGLLGTGGELRAYDAVPQDGTFTLRYLAGIGTSAKFTAPAVGDGRLYVGTRDGHVLGFGVTGAPSLRARGAAFAPTLVGAQAVSSVDITAAGPVTIMGLTTAGDFALVGGAPATPLTLSGGATVSIPVVFQPSTEGAIVGTLQVTTDHGSFAIPLSGVGQSAVPMLVISPPVLTFAPAVLGTVSMQTVTITNVGDAPLTLTGVTPPAPPFTLDGLPAEGTVIDAGGTLVATITYAPTTVGTSSGYLSVAAGDAVAALAVEGSGLMGGKLRIAPEAIDQGAYYIGTVTMASFRLTNEGDVAVIIEKSKPPTSPSFVAVSPFDEGTVLAPGASVEQLVRAVPLSVGSVSDVWQLNANDGQGLRAVTFTVYGFQAPASTPATPSLSLGGPPAASTTPLTAASSTEPQASGGGATGGCAVGGSSSPTGASLVLGLSMIALARRRRARASPIR